MTQIFKRYAANFITMGAVGIPLLFIACGGIIARVGISLLWLYFIIAVITGTMIYHGITYTVKPQKEASRDRDNIA